MTTHLQLRINSSRSIPRLEQQEKAKETDQELHKWGTAGQVVPIITTIALGVLLSPSFAIGGCVGAVICMMTLPCQTSSLSDKEKYQANFFKEEANTSEGAQEMLRRLILYYVCILGPIIEECTLRGPIQSGSIAIGKIALPLVTRQPLMASQLARVHAFSIILAGSLFGAAHLPNKPENGKQAIFCTIRGIVGGILQLKYGLIAAIGLHIVDNTLGILYALRVDPTEEDKVRENRKRIFMSIPASHQ